MVFVGGPRQVGKTTMARAILDECPAGIQPQDAYRRRMTFGGFPEPFWTGMKGKRGVGEGNASNDFCVRMFVIYNQSAIFSCSVCFWMRFAIVWAEWSHYPISVVRSSAPINIKEDFP